MSGFDKFGWLKALQSDARYTDKEQRFGSIICVQFTRRDGTGWTVELDDIAAKVPGGMSHNRVKIALGKFVRDGYLTETGKSSGGRGVKARRSHNLTKPDPVHVQVSEETRTSTVARLGETRTSSGQNPHQNGIKPAPESDTKTSSELREDAPKGTSKGTPEGTAARASAAPTLPDVIPDEKQPEQPDPEPDRYCADHMPDGTDGKCGPCGTRRLRWQQWNVRRDEAIRNCGICDDRGGVGLSAGPFIKCPHDKKRIDELEKYHRAREIESA